MTPERIVRLRSSFNEISARPRALASRFYEELFATTPSLRALFPPDMTSLQGHFEAALALVITATCSAMLATGEWIGAKHERYL